MLFFYGHWGIMMGTLSISAKFHLPWDQGANKGREYRELGYRVIPNFQIPCF